MRNLVTNLHRFNRTLKGAAKQDTEYANMKPTVLVAAFQN